MRQGDLGGGNRLRLQKALSVSLQGAIELCLTGPLVLGLAVRLTESEAGAWLWLAALLGCYAGGACLRLWIPLRSKPLWLLIGLLAAGGWPWLLYGLDGRMPLSGWALGVAGVFLVFRSFRLAESVWLERFPGIILWFGLAAYAPAAFVYRQIEMLQPYAGELNLMGAALFVAAVFGSNRSSLSESALSGERRAAPSGSVVRFNRGLTAGFGLLILLIAFSGMLRRMLEQVGHVIRRLIVAFLDWMSGDEVIPQQQEVKPPSQAEQFPMEPAGEPSIIWVILEYIMYVAVGIAGLILAAYMLRSLYRYLLQAAKRLAAWFTGRRKQGIAENSAYMDEVFSTREGGTLQHLREALGRWMDRGRSGPRWEELRTNRERVRYLYALALRQAGDDGYKWKASLTPAETLEELTRIQSGAGGLSGKRMKPAEPALDRSLVRLYEDARYGGKVPDDDDTHRIAKRLGK